MRLAREEIDALVEKARALARDPRYAEVEKLAANGDWEALCDPVPCRGVTQLQTACPLYHKPECPRWAAEHESYLRYRLRAAGFREVHIGATWGRVPRDMQPKLWEYAQAIRANVADGHGVLLIGDVGPGKTSALALLARTVIEAGHDVTYVAQATNVAAAKLALRTDPDSGAWSDLRNVDVLMLDELDLLPGAPRLQQDTVEELIDYRWGERLTTCAAMNLRPDDPRFGDLKRSMSRLLSMATVIATMEGDQRTKNPKVRGPVN